jgi:hypothetical protein
VQLEVKAAGNAGHSHKTQLDANHRSEAALRLSIAEAVVQVVVSFFEACRRIDAAVADEIPRITFS